MSDTAKRIKLHLTYEQVSALYLTLLRRDRPAFGWMEEPLVAIEAALSLAHSAIHDRGFNSMSRQFFGDDRMAFEEAPIPTDVIAAPYGVEMKLTQERIDWLANAHCPSGVAYPANVKNAIREALREAQSDHSGDGGEKSRCSILAEALEETQGLLVAMLHEQRPREEIEAQIGDNRTALQAALAPHDGDERAYDGDSEESRAAFRAYDERVFVHSRSSWQIWRDACAWQAALASSKAAAVAVDESTYPSDPYIDTMAVNACVAGDGKGRLIFTLQAARKFALDVLRARDDGAFEAVAVSPTLWPYDVIEQDYQRLYKKPDAEAADKQEDSFDTLMAVLNAIGYTEEFAESHPSLKVSEGVKLFLADKAAAVAVGETLYQVNEGSVRSGDLWRDVDKKSFDHLTSVRKYQGRTLYVTPPAPIASSLSDRDIQEAALEWQCDPAFDHFVFHEDELVEYVRGILARVHPAAAQPWINVKDRLPDADRQLVVVFDPEHPELKVWPAQWDAENQAFLAGHYPSAGWFEKDEVTHWMLLQDKP